ncbi:MAG: S8 family serine peptidase [Lachnotalea sp.]
MVEVLDTGIDISHPDFENNIYVNHKEISNNNIDDIKKIHRRCERMGFSGR